MSLDARLLRTSAPLSLSSFGGWGGGGCSFTADAPCFLGCFSSLITARSDRGTRKDRRARSRSDSSRDRGRRSRSRSASRSWLSGRERWRWSPSRSLSSLERSRSSDRSRSRRVRSHSRGDRSHRDRSRRDRSRSSDRYRSRQQRSPARRGARGHAISLIGLVTARCLVVDPLSPLTVRSQGREDGKPDVSNRRVQRRSMSPRLLLSLRRLP